jgi:hypothetical protein
MSDTIDEADGWPSASPGPGVPPSPSVTPGSAPPPPPGSRPRTWSRRGCLVAAVVVGVVGLLVVGGLLTGLALARGWIGDKVDDLAKERQEIVDETGIETGSTDIHHPPQRDIRLGACEYDGEGGVRASGTITNWTGKDADYRVALSFRVGNGGEQGTEFGSTVVTVEGVEPESTTNWAAAVPVGPEGPFTCRIVRIDRWVSGEEPSADGGS